MSTNYAHIAYVTGSTEAAVNALDYLLSVVDSAGSVRELCLRVTRVAYEIYRARPTSAMIVNTLRDILLQVDTLINKGSKLPELKEAIHKYIETKIKEAEKATRQLATIGARRLREEEIILTHSYSRSVLEVIREALRLGKRIESYVTESRPGGEGLKMASALRELGIPVTLIVDSAVRYVIPNVTRILVGAEAIAANGAVIGKVGTSNIALAAREARVRVFVAAGTYKFSVETVFGELVEIPEGDPSLLGLTGREKFKAYVPLMDVTPPDYIDALITERGIIAPQMVPIILKEIYGSWPPRLPEIKDAIRILEATCTKIQ